jgi:hypothetical protein
MAIKILLHDPYSIVLTDETARILFNTTNAVGKIVKLDNAHDLKVTAVVTKQPKNSSIVFDCLLPWKLQESIYPDAKNYVNDWGNNSWRTFVQLNDNANVESVNAKIKDVGVESFCDDKIMQASKPEIELFPCRNGDCTQILKTEKTLVDILNMSGCLEY